MLQAHPACSLLEGWPEDPTAQAATEAAAAAGERRTQEHQCLVGAGASLQQLPTLTLPAPRGGQQAHVLGVGGRLAFLIPKGLQELCTLNQQLFIIK